MQGQSEQDQYGIEQHRKCPSRCRDLFKMMAGVNMVHVLYRGGTGVQADLIAGLVDAWMRNC
jgi:tripartite-type tricarboxylate transporter receptor subunit TctC